MSRSLRKVAPARGLREVDVDQIAVGADGEYLIELGPPTDERRARRDERVEACARARRARLRWRRCTAASIVTVMATPMATAMAHAAAAASRRRGRPEARALHVESAATAATTRVARSSRTRRKVGEVVESIDEAEPQPQRDRASASAACHHRQGEPVGPGDGEHEQERRRGDGVARDEKGEAHCDRARETPEHRERPDEADDGKRDHEELSPPRGLSQPGERGEREEGGALEDRTNGDVREMKVPRTVVCLAEPDESVARVGERARYPACRPGTHRPCARWRRPARARRSAAPVRRRRRAPRTRGACVSGARRRARPPRRRTTVRRGART